MNDGLITQAAKLIKDADAVFVLEGSGMSADSGLETFRGVKGLYDSSDLDLEELINPSLFKKDPDTACFLF